MNFHVVRRAGHVVSVLDGVHDGGMSRHGFWNWDLHMPGKSEKKKKKKKKKKKRFWDMGGVPIFEPDRKA